MADNLIDPDRAAKRIREWLESPEGKRSVADGARQNEQLEFELEELQRIDHTSLHIPCDI